MPEQPEAATDDLMEKVVRLCRHRGFIFPSAEIYGGFRSTYDYGPLGVNMLRNVKDAWWRSMVQLRDDVVGIDGAILSPRRPPPVPQPVAGRQARRPLPQLWVDGLHRSPAVQPHVQDARWPGRG